MSHERAYFIVESRQRGRGLGAAISVRGRGKWRTASERCNYVSLSVTSILTVRLRVLPSIKYDVIVRDIQTALWCSHVERGAVDMDV